MRRFQNTHKGMICVLFLVLTSCHGSHNEGHGTAEDSPDSGSEAVVITRQQFSESDMAIGRPEEVSFSQEIRGNGYIRSSVNGKADVSSLLAGRISKIIKKVGDPVKQGDLICTIEGNAIVELQQSYAESFRELEILESEYLRQKELFKEKIASEKTYLSAQGAYKSMLARVSGLEAKLGMSGIDPVEVENGNIRRSIGIRAPIEGILTHQPVYSGVFAEPGMTISRIVDPAGMQLDLYIFQKDASSVEVGLPVVFKSPEQSDLNIHAVITHTGIAVDPDTRTIQCTARIKDAENYNLLDGMYVDFSIITCERTATAIPVYAAMEEHNRYFVMKKTGETETDYLFSKTVITSGAVQDGYIEVLDEDLGEILISGSYLVIGAE